jgi:hypothetical protein
VLKRVVFRRLLQREHLSQSVKKLAAVIRGEPRLSAVITFVQHRSMTLTPDDVAQAEDWDFSLAWELRAAFLGCPPGSQSKRSANVMRCCTSRRYVRHRRFATDADVTQSPGLTFHVPIEAAGRWRMGHGLREEQVHKLGLTQEQYMRILGGISAQELNEIEWALAEMPAHLISRQLRKSPFQT